MGQPDEARGVQQGIRATFLLIGDETIQRKLQDDSTAPDALDQLRVPPEARQPLLDIVNKLSKPRGRSAGAQPEHDSGGRSSDDQAGSSEVERVLLESFVHIRWSFWTSMGMSVILFLVGIVLIVLAVLESLETDDVSTSTLTIAGMGMGSFVAVFYTGPWRNIANNLANSQQIRMIATSYLAGMSLVRNGSPEHQNALKELTNESLDLVQRYVEDPPLSGNRNSGGSDQEEQGGTRLTELT